MPTAIIKADFVRAAQTVVTGVPFSKRTEHTPYSLRVRKPYQTKMSKLKLSHSVVKKQSWHQVKTVNQHSAALSSKTGMVTLSTCGISLMLENLRMLN